MSRGLGLRYNLWPTCFIEKKLFNLGFPSLNSFSSIMEHKKLFLVESNFSFIKWTGSYKHSFMIAKACCFGFTFQYLVLNLLVRWSTSEAAVV